MSLPKISSLHARGWMSAMSDGNSNTLMFPLRFLNACHLPCTVWSCVSNGRSLLCYGFIIRIGFNPWLKQPALGITCFLLCFAWVLSSFFFGVLGRARVAMATSASLLSTPGLPLPHEFSPRSLSALTYRQIQDLGVVGSIFSSCSEPSEGLWLFNALLLLVETSPMHPFTRQPACDVMRTR